jgi:LmbE family N-acetylglucosaminyl deacetylase
MISSRRGGWTRAAQKGLRARKPAGSSALGFEPGADALVLSPHFDDAVLDFWSVLTAPAPLTVINVFAGIPHGPCLTDWDRFCGATDSVEWTRRRREEDARALALVGRTPINLPLVQTSSCIASGERPAAVGDVAQAVTGAVHAASAVYAPAGIGGHPDHLLVREFALELAEQGISVHLAADLPYAVRRGGWPTWIADDGGAASADEDWRQFLTGIEGLELERVRTVRLTDEQALAKLAAAKTHETQFRHLDGEERRLSRLDNIRFEVFWEVAGTPAG